MNNPFSWFGRKIETFKYNVTQNGLWWTLHFACFRATEAVMARVGAIQARVLRRMTQMEIERRLPGLNTVRRNFHIWEESTDWKHMGEVWNESEEWKQALIDHVLLKEVPPGKDVLEIGPGGGRWTEPLQKISKSVAVVDLSERCLELCRKRFEGCSNMSYHLTQGTDLGFLADNSIDTIWAFDVFVHISPHDTEEYFKGFARVLRTGGRGVIHHAKEGGLHGGWRSRMTDKLFAELLEKHGMRAVRQFDTWGPNHEFSVKFHHDVITVFEKP